MKRVIVASQESDLVKKHFEEVYPLAELLENYDMWGFEEEAEFKYWLKELLADKDCTLEDVAYVGYDGMDNDKLIMEDGTIFAIEGNYGQDYLVDITDMYDED